MESVTHQKVSKRSASLRNTSQRRVVYQSVEALKNHPTSAEVFAEAKKRHESISRATVYRNLDVLVQEGSLLRIELPSGPHRYDHTVTPHAHATCRVCGSVFDIEVGNLDTVIEATAQKNKDFTFEQCHIHFEGVCHLCG